MKYDKILNMSLINIGDIRVERLPTNTTTKNHPIHRWFNFIAGFSPEYVDFVCKEQYSVTEKTLLDPFSGCGTSLVQALQNDFSIVGYEAHPFFYQIGKAKLIKRNSLNVLNSITEAINIGFNNPISVSREDNPGIDFLSKLIPESYLDILFGAKLELENRNLDNVPLAVLVLSKVLDDCCCSATDGIYKAPSTKKKNISPNESLEKIYKIISEDLNCAKIGRNKVKVFNKSSEKMSEIKDQSVSLIITSPPYLNNFDYAEMTRMYLYFWGIAKTWSEVSEKIRSKLIVNTTTALKGQKKLQEQYRSELPFFTYELLDEWVFKLREKRMIKKGKKDYNYLIYPYFAQMFRVLRECYRVLDDKGFISIMVGDSALYGIHITSQTILGKLMEDIGFHNINIQLIRSRGYRWVQDKREGSATGLGEYCITAKKE